MTRIVNDLGANNVVLLVIVASVLVAFTVSRFMDLFTRDAVKSPAELAAEQIDTVLDAVRWNDVSPAEGERLILAIREALVAPAPQGGPE